MLVPDTFVWSRTIFFNFVFVIWFTVDRTLDSSENLFVNLLMASIVFYSSEDSFLLRDSSTNFDFLLKESKVIFRFLNRGRFFSSIVSAAWRISLTF